MRLILLTNMQQKTAVYQSIRGMRAPVTMGKHLGQQLPRRSNTNNDPMVIGSPPPQTSESPDLAPRMPVVGKASVQFAGVTNSEVLWALPNQKPSPGASSEFSSGAGQSSLGIPAAGMDDLMADIDWVSLTVL